MKTPASILEVSGLRVTRDRTTILHDLDWRVRHGEHWEPLFCVIPTALTEAFEQAWLAGERSPRKIMLQLNARAWQCAENDPRLSNFNTPDLLD